MPARAILRQATNPSSYDAVLQSRKTAVPSDAHCSRHFLRLQYKPVVILQCITLLPKRGETHQWQASHSISSLLFCWRSQPKKPFITGAHKRAIKILEADIPTLPLRPLFESGAVEVWEKQRFSGRLRHPEPLHTGYSRRGCGLMAHLLHHLHQTRIGHDIPAKGPQPSGRNTA